MARASSAAGGGRRWPWTSLAPFGADRRLRGSLMHADGELSGLYLVRIDKDGDRQRPSGARVRCSCVWWPAAAGGPPSALDLTSVPWAKLQAALLALARERVALWALNDADRPGWRQGAAIGAHVQCLVCEAASSDGSTTIGPGPRWRLLSRTAGELQAMRLARARGRAALWALNDADRPGWRQRAAIGGPRPVLVRVAASSGGGGLR